jgi:hypothetical protein
MKTTDETRRKHAITRKARKAESERAEEILTKYRRLLMDVSVERKLLAVPSDLNDFRDRRLYFEMPKLLTPICTHVYGHALADLKHECEQNLSAAGCQKLERGMSAVMSDVIREVSMADEWRRVADVRTSTFPKEQLIRSYLADLASASDRQLYAGFAVLAKDMEEYLTQVVVAADDESKAIQETSATFREVVAEVESFKPKDLSALRQDSTLPTGFAKQARRGKASVDSLLDSAIDKPWTITLGQEFWHEFANRLKANICGPHGLYAAVKKGQESKVAAPVALITAVLEGSHSYSTLWYPLAVYVGLLIVRTGLDVYCEGECPKTPRKRTTRKKSPTKRSQRKKK